MIFIYFIALGK